MEIVQRIMAKVVGQEISKEELEKVAGAGKGKDVPCEGTSGPPTYYSSGKVVCKDT
ncbi:hypothetical protein GTP58_21095 [Duganella sp. CY15W]|uniref:hypothetical protein n=1 Tax=Duganella sp. CY15W TaxID=2692172 RepID=UPI001370710B|nr:hypothetical protein [Duganella sp. CY15W]MYM30836.1 hypothetical protein [Duganella sp. CY15W]